MGLVALARAFGLVKKHEGTSKPAPMYFVEDHKERTLDSDRDTEMRILAIASRTPLVT